MKIKHTRTAWPQPSTVNILRSLTLHVRLADVIALPSARPAWSVNHRRILTVDGMASAVYGQYPPLVNASRPPGRWQSYDIVFHGPRFDPEGKLLRAARVTVLHNGVLVQDDVELSGPTAHGERPPYKAQPEKLPLALQDHGNPVRYRNIWIRELK